MIFIRRKKSWIVSAYLGNIRPDVSKYNRVGRSISAERCALRGLDEIHHVAVVIIVENNIIKKLIGKMTVEYDRLLWGYAQPMQLTQRYCNVAALSRLSVQPH